MFRGLLFIGFAAITCSTAGCNSGLYAVKRWSAAADSHLRDDKETNQLEFREASYADYDTNPATDGWQIPPRGRMRVSTYLQYPAADLINAASEWVPPNLPSELNVNGVYLGRHQWQGRNLDVFLVEVDRVPPIFTFPLEGKCNVVIVQLAVRDVISREWRFGSSFVPEPWHLTTIGTASVETYQVVQKSDGLEVSAPRVRGIWQVELNGFRDTVNTRD